MPWHIRMILVLFLTLILAYLFIGFRFSRAISNLFSFPINRARFAVFSTIVLTNLFPLILIIYYSSGNLKNLYFYKETLSWQDLIFTFPFWVSTAAIIEMLPYFLLVDFLNLPFRYFKSFHLSLWSKIRQILQVTMPVVFLLYAGIKIYQDTFMIRTNEFSIQLNSLPEQLNNFTITLFGDIQVDRYTQESKISLSEKAISKTNPDLLLFAGDLVTSGQKFIQQGINALCKLEASIGKAGCMGDHDYWASPSKIPQGLEMCGWDFLRNQHQIFKYKNQIILVTGITFIYSKRLTDRQIKDLLYNSPKADLKILLVHQPSTLLIESAKKAGYDLFLAGHTHGGQLVFHPFGFELTPTRFENSFFSGHKKLGNMHMIITNGIGVTLAPIRYGAPAEICKITLLSE